MKEWGWWGGKKVGREAEEEGTPIRGYVLVERRRGEVSKSLLRLLLRLLLRRLLRLLQGLYVQRGTKEKEDVVQGRLNDGGRCHGCIGCSAQEREGQRGQGGRGWRGLQRSARCRSGYSCSRRCLLLLHCPRK